MADYYDANFEADCPKFVDFTVSQNIDDNADEWFNFDHENGVPVTFEESQEEPMQTSHDEDNQTKEEYHECNDEVEQATTGSPVRPTQDAPPQVESNTPPIDNGSPQSAVPLLDITPPVQNQNVEPLIDSSTPPGQEAPPQINSSTPLVQKVPLQVDSTPPVQKVVPQVNSTPPVDSGDSGDEEVPPVISITDLTTDSPALPLQQEPSTVVTTAPSLEQDNLALINVSAENTPKETKKEMVVTSKPKPSNIVTSWADEENDTSKQQNNGHLRPTRSKNTAQDRIVATHSNRRSTRRSVASTTRRSVDTMATKRMPSVASVRKSRSSPRTGAATKRAPSVDSARKRRSSPHVATSTKRAPSVDSARKRRSSPHVATSTKRAPSVDSARKRRSSPHMATSTKRASSVDSARNRSSCVASAPSVDLSTSGKRKRTSSPPTNTRKSPNPRKSPRLQNQKPKLTMPHTPNCVRRQVASKSGIPKSSLDLEMEKIAKKQTEAKKALELSKRSYQMAKDAAGYYPARSAQEPTRPSEFKFETDSRVKNHSMETRQDSDMKDFVGGLRKHPKSPSKTKGPTVQKPFSFTNNRKRHNEESDPSGVASKFRPMALQIREFHRRTPERFRTKVNNDVAKGPNPMKAVHSKPSLTCPKTPNLETRSRKRPVTAVSAAEKEELEVQEMKSHTFRARPIDSRVMSNLNIGVTKPTHKSPTKAVGFNLECDKRFREREASRQTEEEETHEFHAQEVNPKMLQGTIGVAPAKTLPLTCPKSPAFALKNRVRTVRSTAPASPEEAKESRIMHANPIPHTGVPFIPNLNHKVTEPKPFSFDHRDKDMKARKEAKINEMIREEEQLCGQFKAQPLPTYEHPSLPEKKVKPTTRPEPFLSVEARATRQAEEWSKKMEEELTEQRRLASGFKANPAEVLYEAPFIPLKSNKALTDAGNFQLNTDRRAVERQGFEENKHAREAELRAAVEERRLREEEEERKAVERLRQEMVHKSNPVRRFKEVQVLPSTRPLTQPESPQFATDTRLRNQPRL